MYIARVVGGGAGDYGAHPSAAGAHAATVLFLQGMACCPTTGARRSRATRAAGPWCWRAPASAPTYVATLHHPCTIPAPTSPPPAYRHSTTRAGRGYAAFRLCQFYQLCHLCHTARTSSSPRARGHTARTGQQTKAAAWLPSTKLCVHRGVRRRCARRLHARRPLSKPNPCPPRGRVAKRSRSFSRVLAWVPGCLGVLATAGRERGHQQAQLQRAPLRGGQPRSRPEPPCAQREGAPGVDHEYRARQVRVAPAAEGGRRGRVADDGEAPARVAGRVRPRREPFNFTPWGSIRFRLALRT